MSHIDFLNDLEMVQTQLARINLEVGQTGNFEKYVDLMDIICQELGIKPTRKAAAVEPAKSAVEEEQWDEVEVEA